MDRFLLKDKDVIIEYTDVLPPNVNGMVKEKFGVYYILIKNSLSDAKKIRTLLHELDHIRNNDLMSDKSVNEIERRKP